MSCPDCGERHDIVSDGFDDYGTEMFECQCGHQFDATEAGE